MAQKLTQAAILARRAYQREWRRNNKDKVKANNRRYWERRAQKEAMAEGRVQ